MFSELQNQSERIDRVEERQHEDHLSITEHGEGKFPINMVFACVWFLHACMCVVPMLYSHKL